MVPTRSSSSTDGGRLWHFWAAWRGLALSTKTPSHAMLQSAHAGMVGCEGRHWHSCAAWRWAGSTAPTSAPKFARPPSPFPSLLLSPSPTPSSPSPTSPSPPLTSSCPVHDGDADDGDHDEYVGDDDDGDRRSKSHDYNMHAC